MEYFDKFIDFLVEMTIKFIYLMAEKPSEMIIAFLILFFLIVWAWASSSQQPQSDVREKPRTYYEDPPETMNEMLNRVKPDPELVENMHKGPWGRAKANSRKKSKKKK
jgi:hypothetical protein